MNGARNLKFDGNQPIIIFPRWIIIWLSISMIIVFWDVTFILFRPSSFPEGNLGFLWIPYAYYIKIDKSYADLDNAFVLAQAIMSLFEIGIGLIALFNYLAGKIIWASLIAFSSMILTCTKTIFIFLLEILEGFKNIGHNTLTENLLSYVLPNTIWIVVPLVAVIILGRNLVYLADLGNAQHQNDDKIVLPTVDILQNHRLG